MEKLTDDIEVSVLFAFLVSKFEYSNFDFNSDFSTPVKRSLMNLQRDLNKISVCTIRSFFIAILLLGISAITFIFFYSLLVPTLYWSILSSLLAIIIILAVALRCTYVRFILTINLIKIAYQTQRPKLIITTQFGLSHYMMLCFPSRLSLFCVLRIEETNKHSMKKDSIRLVIVPNSKATFDQVDLEMENFSRDSYGNSSERPKNDNTLFESTNEQNSPNLNETKDNLRAFKTEKSVLFKKQSAKNKSELTVIDVKMKDEKSKSSIEMTQKEKQLIIRK